MTHEPTRVPTKGACIYCGDTSSKLTDEHIVPLSIGGHHIIEKASCTRCARITGKFERDVMRGLWGDARISYNAPTRRPKKRKTHLTLPIGGAATESLRVPYSDYPAPMVFYKMHKAGLLLGLPEAVDVSKSWDLVTIVDQERLEKFEEKNPGQLTARFRHVPDSFGRMIAKIGYGQVLSSLDLGDFRPICLPFILGEKVNVSYVVGGRFEPAEPNPGMGYVLRVMGFGTHNHIVIMAEVRLIADNHTPIYHVVVGDVSGASNVERMFHNLDSVDFAFHGPDSVTWKKSRDEHHWMPEVWPLAYQI